MPRATLLVALSLVAALWTGCGSPDEIRKSLSKQAYVARADAICGEMDARLLALGPPRRPEQLAPFARKAVPVIQSTLERLRKLDAPQDLAVPVGQFHADVAAAVDRLRQAGAAAESGNAAVAERLGNEAKLHAEAATRVARRIGYRVCGRFPGL